MKEIKIDDKQSFFEKNYPFADPPDLLDRKRCLHCDSIFVVGNFKVFEDQNHFQFICCPNAPDCDGTVIDWIEPDKLDS